MPRVPPKYTPPDDTQVPRQQGTPAKEGWKMIMHGIGRDTVNLLQSPDGRQFIPADSRAKADLIVEFPGKGLRPVRYQLFTRSPAAKRERRLKRAK